MEPISIRACYLYKGDQKFMVRGVVYQDTISNHGHLDSIPDNRLERLRHDIVLFKELGINTIYVYCIDNTLEHSQAMKLLQEAGIYVLVTVSTPRNCISRFDTASSYNSDNLTAYFKTVDVMAQYPNTLGVVVADNLVNDQASEACVPYVAAVVRDVKQYMRLKHKATGQRILPVSYGAATCDERDREILEYLATRSEADRIDFAAPKHYFDETSEEAFKDWTHYWDSLKLPIFLSEYSGFPAGSQNTRSFLGSKLLYNLPLNIYLSGGIVYEFPQGSNSWGIVQVIENLPPVTIGRRRLFVRLTAEDQPQRKPVAEIRKTEIGTVLISEDFVNYKTRLAETAGVAHKQLASRSAVPNVGPEKPDGAEGGWAWGHMPQSCVDWDGVRRELGV